MRWTIYHHWMWIWCWACYRAYMALPAAESHDSRYGRFMMGRLGYAGAYAHSDKSNFHLCSFFEQASQDRSDA